MISLMERIERMVSIIPVTGCWMWMGTLSPSGYGKMSIGTRRPNAHRVVYAAYNGRDMADVGELDHLCRHPWCVNPEHMEEVSHAENMRRARHPKSWRGMHAQQVCDRGHIISRWNRLPGNHAKHWRCRICKRDYSARYHQQWRSASSTTIRAAKETNQ